MEVEEPLESVEEEDEGVMNNVELCAMMAQGFPTNEEGSIMPCVSVHTLNGVYDFKTIRVTSSVNGKAVQVLIDKGSTHNSLDLTTAKRLGCCLSRGCNMVLDIQWLVTLGDVVWNFRQLKMKFSVMGKKVSLRGLQPPFVKVVQYRKIEKLSTQLAELCMISVGVMKERTIGDAASLFSIEVKDEPSDIPADLQEVLSGFEDVFEVPQGLPPTRSHGHRIVLKKGTPLVNIRPYRYRMIQKDEIEKNS
ncbi:hypothetical protein T459_23859 [Capsicum annuum]|uniref:Uncharacterized protein n=1 Tax=Capsicum annuum TaxID=4072 RepID=A0A2G2YTP5_CAPAN|nr:hypothetical protein FXO37_21323 [Capsicum annuum]PHT73074.1 hypothetical protein T459_23859 [Capsicum annuum]